MMPRPSFQGSLSTQQQEKGVEGREREKELSAVFLGAVLDGPLLCGSRLLTIRKYWPRGIRFRVLSLHRGLLWQGISAMQARCVGRDAHFPRLVLTIQGLCVCWLSRWVILT